MELLTSWRTVVKDGNEPSGPAGLGRVAAELRAASDAGARCRGRRRGSSTWPKFLQTCFLF